MTMDVQKSLKNYSDLPPECNKTDIEIANISSMPSHGVPSKNSKSTKRAFDVAFLMMPDEKLRHKQEKHLRVSKQLFIGEEWSQKRTTDSQGDQTFNANQIVRNCHDDRLRSNNNLSPNLMDSNIDVGTDEYPSKVNYASDSDNSEKSRSRPNSNDSAARIKFIPEVPFKNKIFDDPSLVSARARFENRFIEKFTDLPQKSAFTKVTNYTMNSPSPSLSPDIYQNSVSPPLTSGLSALNGNNFHKNHSFDNILSPANFLNGNFYKNENTSSSMYADALTTHCRNSVSFNKNEYSPEKHNHSSKKFLPFRQDIPQYLPRGSSYPFSMQNFHSPNSDFMKLPTPTRETANPLIGNPAAAILSTLLPPTLAAFSLPAQNVCAKCNISFRMTSDLVYHMRTHHKSETAVDPSRRKREEKLKCPVCNESFRERHHLTRHMTAHQDKEGDIDDTPTSLHKKKYFSNNPNTSLNK